MTLRETLESMTVDQLKQRLALIPGLRGATRKADLVATISGYLLSDSLTAALARLSDLECSAVAEAVYAEHAAFSLDGFKAKYGAGPTSLSAALMAGTAKTESERSRPPSSAAGPRIRVGPTRNAPTAPPM
jgi:hypothetical protein